MQLRNIIRTLLGKQTHHLRYLGTQYGGWTVAKDLISEHSIVYSVGIGEDISFDLALIEEYGVKIHAFDPTPRSIDWLQNQSLPEEFEYHAYGLSDKSGQVDFYPHQNPEYVSHSVLQRNDTSNMAITVTMKSLEDMAEMLGHSYIDLLKIDIEGSEYSFINSISSWEHLKVKQLLVEFHPRFVENKNATNDAIGLLRKFGYRLVHKSKTTSDYTFIRTT